MPHFAASELCLHCLHNTLKLVSGLKKVKVWVPLLLGNTCFKKCDSHLIRYKSGNAATQIDFILSPRAVRKLVTDVKVIPGEEVALQHQLLVCDRRFDLPPKPNLKFMPRLKVWKLTDPQRRNHFQEVFKLHVSASAGVSDAAIEDIWNNLKTGLLKTTEDVCGTTRPYRWRRETWWWNGRGHYCQAASFQGMEDC